MSSETGPASLRRLVEDLRDSDNPLSRTQATIYTDDMAKLRKLAAQWEAERQACQSAVEEADRLRFAAEAQAAADRAALATAQHANDAERGEWSEYYALLTGDRGAWSPDDMRRAVKAQTDALAQARALLPEELTECVGGRGYERCGCANVDKDNHCMYCLYPPWAHDLAATLSGAR